MARRDGKAWLSSHVLSLVMQAPSRSGSRFDYSYIDQRGKWSHRHNWGCDVLQRVRANLIRMGIETNSETPAFPAAHILGDGAYAPDRNTATRSGETKTNYIIGWVAARSSRACPPAV